MSPMEILILVSLILLNGVFAMSEIALVTARKARLARLADEGDRAAAIAVRLGEDPTRFLSTIQIGITSIGILSGIFGESALAIPLAAWLETFGIQPKTASILATVLVVALITYVAIVVGELVPKRIGQMSPEAIARLVARPMQALASLSRPFVFLLAGSTSLLLRLLGRREVAEESVTEEEIHALLSEGSRAGVIEKSEHDMVRNVFRLDERDIHSLMVPRADILWLDVDRPLEENLALVEGSVHSRFPLCRGGLEEVLGIVTARELLTQSLRDGTLDLPASAKPATYVPESLTGMELLEQFRSASVQMVLVVDEYGDIQGLVTLHDVIEAVTGEMCPADQQQGWAVQREDGSWLLDGLMPMFEVKDLLALRSVPGMERGRYHTLAGMIMLLLGRLPATGDIATWQGWRFEVLDLDGRRIDKVLASPLPESVAPQSP